MSVHSISRDQPGPNQYYSTEIFSGSYVDFSRPLPDQFDLNSIAEGLSKICRYGGQSAFFYSVAEHAYYVSKRLEWMGLPVAVQLAGLHHDDAEAVIGDITTPLKRYLAYRQIEMLQGIGRDVSGLLEGRLGDRVSQDELLDLISGVRDIVHARETSIIKELEEKVLAAIVVMLGFDEDGLPLDHPAVKTADLWALAGEAQQLVPSQGEGWITNGVYDAHPDLTAIGLGSERAAKLWLARHNDLAQQIPGNPVLKVVPSV